MLDFRHLDLVAAEPDRAERLESLLQAVFGLKDPAQIPAKLGLGEGWSRLLAVLRGDDVPDADLASVLRTLHRAVHGLGAGERYLAILKGTEFSLTAAGVRWQRLLGPTSPDGEAFHQAMQRLRWASQGLHMQKQVDIAGQRVDWAIAGLLPTGEALRVAIRVRPAPSPLSALAEDLADDALAAAGFEVLGLREWQLRYPGTCALEIGDFCAKRAPFLRFPAKLFDPDDDHPVHRHQAAPARLTPREASPNWALREALRRSHGDLDAEAFLDLYRAQVLTCSLDSAEDEEWTVWG